MSFFVTNGEWKVGRILAFLLFLGLLIYFIIVLLQPMSEDKQCDPPRKNLEFVATISGYILWSLATLGGIYFLFIRRTATGQTTFAAGTSGGPRFKPKKIRFRNPMRTRKAKVGPAAGPAAGPTLYTK